MHGLDVALRCGALVPDLGALRVALHAKAALIQRAEAELRHGKAAGGRALIPLRGFLEILIEALAFGEARGDLELRRSVALGGRDAQREGTDGRRRQLRAVVGRRDLVVGDFGRAAVAAKDMLFHQRSGRRVSRGSAELAGEIGHARLLVELRQLSAGGVVVLHLDAGKRGGVDRIARH